MLMMTKRSFWSRFAAVVVGATALIGLGATLIVDLPTVTREPATTTVTPATGPTTRLCPGPARTTQEAVTPVVGESLGAVTVTGGAFQVPDLGWMTLAGEPIAASDQGQAGEFSWLRLATSEAAVASLATQVASEQQVAVAQSQLVATEQASGLVATECSLAQYESWLVGGSTETGRDSYLRLVNVSGREAQVSINVFTRQGLASSSTAPLVVAPASERTIPLSSLITSTSGIVIQVTAANAPVASYLQQSTIRGLTPGGISLLSASASPALELDITGVVVSGAEQQRELSAREEFQDAANMVRLFATEREAQVTLHGTSAEGGVVEKTQTVPALSVVDVDLSDVADGIYHLDVIADQPVIASAKVVRGGETTPDFEWIASSKQLADSTMVAVPPTQVGSAILILATASSEPIDLELIAADGSSQPLRVSSAAPISVAVDHDVVYRLTNTSQVTGTLAIGDGTRVATIGLTSATLLTGTIVVAP